MPIPLGNLLAGPMERAFGLVGSLVGCATVIVAVAWMPLLSRGVRAMGLPAPERAAPVAARAAAGAGAVT
ncbi:hypothetical protein FHU30_004240 [Actinomadura rupiterrae]|nr:hypothetical protein [Actinomadura rupiterrae]